MTVTCADIVSRAARSLGLTQNGQVPEGADAQDLLQHLQDVIDGLPLLRDGEWTEVILTSAAAYTALDGDRIHTAGYAATITLPTTFTDECGNTVPQLDLSRVQIIGGTQAGLWLYAASNGSWAQIDALSASDDSPFGNEDTAGLAAMLAVAASGEYVDAPAVVSALAGKARANLKARLYRDVIVGVDSAFLRTANLGNGASFFYTRTNG